MEGEGRGPLKIRWPGDPAQLHLFGQQLAPIGAPKQERSNPTSLCLTKTLKRIGQKTVVEVFGPRERARG